MESVTRKQNSEGKAKGELKQRKRVKFGFLRRKRGGRRGVVKSHAQGGDPKRPVKQGKVVRKGRQRKRSKYETKSESTLWKINVQFKTSFKLREDESIGIKKAAKDFRTPHGTVGRGGHGKPKRI